MKIKTAVVGFGFMGAVHAKNILESGNMELAAIIESRTGDIFSGMERTGNHGNLQLPMERLKKTAVYNSLEECARSLQIEAVIISVPLFLQLKDYRNNSIRSIDSDLKI